jgi:hypothetical protein
MIGEIEVATSGTIERDDRCPACGVQMLYRVDAREQPVSMFCGNLSDGCPEVMREVRLG